LCAGARGGGPAPSSIELVRGLLAEGIQVGQPVAAGRLSLFPLTHGLRPCDHLLYQDAHARGPIQISPSRGSTTCGQRTPGLPAITVPLSHSSITFTRELVDRIVDET